MKKLTIYLFLLFIAFSCDDYLDVEPKGKVIPTTIEDYDLLLNGGSYSVHTVQNEEVLGYTGNDFKYIPSPLDTSNPNNQQFQLFSYGSQRFYNPSMQIPAWNNSYNNIYIFNKVIEEAGEALPSIGYEESDKARLIAEAKYGRALDYFYLVNTFAKHYSAKNADTPGVPIVLKADVSEEIGQRNTVGEVYDLVINDLTEALPNLPNTRVGVTRPDKAAGYALLARVYLYKGDYDLAAENATQAINLKGELSDYVNTTDFASSYEKEQFSNRYFGGASGLYSSPNADYKAIIDTVNDARYSQVFAFYPGYGVYQKVFFWYNQTPSLGEMYVTRAEANARLGNTSKAIEDLNELRKHRIANHQELSSNDFLTNTDLVRFALEERRREVVFTLTNVFDVKRRNLQTELEKTIVHVYNGVEYKAAPNAGKLVLPIPASVMKFHTDWEQN